MTGHPGAVTAAGWYGKLPSLGDFASRRLDSVWIGIWDGWLTLGQHALRESSPEGWLPRYLASPAWRFALMPGVLDGSFRVGTLVPSVDRVGRYYPLAVFSPALAPPANAAVVSALWQWAGAVEDIVVAALQQDWSAETFDAAVVDAGMPASMVVSLAQPAHHGFVAGLAALRWQALQGHSLWCHRAAAGTPLCVRGLPMGADFEHLFPGS